MEARRAMLLLAVGMLLFISNVLAAGEELASIDGEDLPDDLSEYAIAIAALPGDLQLLSDHPLVPLLVAFDSNSAAMAMKAAASADEQYRILSEINEYNAQLLSIWQQAAAYHEDKMKFLKEQMAGHNALACRLEEHVRHIQQIRDDVIDIEVRKQLKEVRKSLERLLYQAYEAEDTAFDAMALASDLDKQFGKALNRRMRVPRVTRAIEKK